MIAGITEKEQKTIERILDKYSQDYAFFYYGSRVKGTYEITSDLDVLVKGAAEMPLTVLQGIKEEFDNSDLPYIVNFSDYYNLDNSFYERIKPDLIPYNWQEVKLGDICEITSSKRVFMADYVTSGIPFYRSKEIIEKQYGNNISTELFITEKKYEEIKQKFSVPQEGDILLTSVGTLGIPYIVKKNEKFYFKDGNLTWIKKSEKLLPKYLYYFLISTEGKSKLENISIGTTQKAITIVGLKGLEISLPPLSTQQKIASVLGALDNKIELNQWENNNLEQQAFAIFNSMFDFCAKKNKIIGDYITPKRGKNLLSKNAVYGDVPVVAGGLNPATYHNVANTSAPVITISASGANAGYINLWHIPVWSSDSSYIDESLTASVYFWYVLLKQRQKEIFDSQTGSAQPHIYPQHIANLPISNINEDDMDLYNNNVSALFKKIGLNIKENQRLIQLRDALLPKLMSGEIDISNVNISTDKLSFTED